MTRGGIVVCAYSGLGHACLKLLLDRQEKVVLVYTHEDSPTEKIWFPSVAALAREHNIPVKTPASKSLAAETPALQSLAPDLLFSFYYRHMIPQAWLDIPKLGAFNMHGSLLPKFRGRASINWVVLKGETETGASLHVMEEKPDAGDLVDQEKVLIGPDDTAAVVQQGVTTAAVQVLSRQLENLKAGKAPRHPQNLEAGSYFGGRKPEDGEIQWDRPAHEIHNLVRAVTHPYPGAFTHIFGKKTYIWRTQLDRRKSGSFPGQILFENNHLSVAAGDLYLVQLLRVQNDGEEERDGGDFGQQIWMEARRNT